MKNEITEAQLLLNNEIVVTFAPSQFHGHIGIVEAIMADGRTLDVRLANGKNAFLDVTFVRELRERQHNEPKQSLGAIANHLVKETL